MGPGRHRRCTSAASSIGPLSLSLSLSLCLSHCLSLSLSESLNLVSLALSECVRLLSHSWRGQDELKLPPPGDREPSLPGVACAPQLAAPCAAGAGVAAEVATGEFGFTVKPKTKTKSSSTDAPIHADVSVQTSPRAVPAKSMPTTKPPSFKPPPMPKPPPPPPQPPKFGVGANASTGGLSEAGSLASRPWNSLKFEF